MKPLPADPHAFQARVVNALFADILDDSQPGFARLDALHAVALATDERDDLPAIRSDLGKAVA